MRDYISLHAHSEFSNVKIIDSINRYDRSIDYCWDLGLGGVAMTEHDCVSGAIKYIKAFKKKLSKEWAKEHPDEELKTDEDYNRVAEALDFKPILGNEIYLSEEGLTEQTNDEWTKEGHPGHFYHLILLAKDAEGFKQIRQLSSAAWKRAWFRGILRTPTYPSDLEKFVSGGHLICCTACLGGVPPYYVNKIYECGEKDVDGQYKWFYELQLWLRNMEIIFGPENFFIELQPNYGPKGADQNKYNRFMLKHFWGKYNFIFSTDAHYLKAEERNIHKAFLNSKSSKDREVDDFYQCAYFMSQEEAAKYLEAESGCSAAQVQEMVNNTKRIGKMCEVYDLNHKQILATVPYEKEVELEESLMIFDDVDEETYPNFYYYLHTKEPSDHYLAELVAQGFIEKYDAKKWDLDIYYKRLEEEFWTLNEVSKKIDQHMSDYFITMSKMIDLMWNKAQSLVGPSRGSAGALLINYLLGITQINPIELDLPYVWRFLHPSRPELPDIDIDSESDKRMAVFNAIRDFFVDLGGDVINVCTFGTEGTKSAIKTAARGLDIDDDTVAYITSMIPNERGFDWSLHDCYYGNGGDRKPIAAFVAEMNSHSQLWELAQAIEGLVTRLGVHASGVVMVNSDFTEFGSYMKTTKEQIVTAYDLHDQEYAGLVKYDLLTVSALDRIRQAMNYMLEDGLIQWKGSLRKTYDAYLSPSIINYTDEEMWDMASNGMISSLFQFDTSVGSQAIKQIRPHSLKELAIANSVMRLMGDGELPLDKYVKFKTAPELWYNEMRAHQLTDEEQHLLEKYLKDRCGVADTQEVLMQMVMDPQISGFTMQEANKLRKTIAKKDFREIDAVKDLFFNKGKECGSSQNLLSYVWYVQISMSLGYSFSSLHTTGYSVIAIQEMNLARFYPIIYWNCACLSVDSSAINSSDFYNLIDENIIDIDTIDADGNGKNKMDYAKLASALDKFRKICTIKTPDINESRLSFRPLAKDNTILYGLKGITKITDPVIQQIMNNRPYKSLDDFIEKVAGRIITKDKIINLIKCGAFDNIEKIDRKDILAKFIRKICAPKQKLTLQNMSMLINNNLLPQELDDEVNVYLLTKELRKHRDESKNWYRIDELAMPIDKIEAWKAVFKKSKIAPESLSLSGLKGNWIEASKWDHFYDAEMNVCRDYIKKNQADLLNKLNQQLFDAEWNNYCSGDKLQWELDSLNFYFSGHPLTKIYKDVGVELSRLDSIIEGAVDGSFFIKGKTIPRMKLYTIIGTVIDRDKTKGVVTLQTIDGVVSLKVYKDLYSTMIAVTKNQESFFEKGVHLMVTGILRGASFIPKVYKNTGRKSIMHLILSADGQSLERVEAKEGIDTNETAGTSTNS